MRDRIINTELPARWFNISEEEVRAMVVNDESQDMFTNLLFSRVMPNLKRIGLLTDKVMPLYEKLNLTSYMDSDDEFEIEWAELNKPLETSSEIDQQSEKELAAHTAQGLF
jgi:23S rRNA G2445 N2-methylase RlmL